MPKLPKPAKKDDVEKRRKEQISKDLPKQTKVFGVYIDGQELCFYNDPRNPLLWTGDDGETGYG